MKQLTNKQRSYFKKELINTLDKYGWYEEAEIASKVFEEKIDRYLFYINRLYPDRYSMLISKLQKGLAFGGTETIHIFGDLFDKDEESLYSLNISSNVIPKIKTLLYYARLPYNVSSFGLMSREVFEKIYKNNPHIRKIGNNMFDRLKIAYKEKGVEFIDKSPIKEIKYIKNYKYKNKIYTSKQDVIKDITRSITNNGEYTFTIEVNDAKKES